MVTNLPWQSNCHKKVFLTHKPPIKFHLVTISCKIKSLWPKEICEKNLSNQFSEPVRSAQIPPDICSCLLGIWTVLRYECIIIYSIKSQHDE